jgi:hypothetical protein
MAAFARARSYVGYRGQPGNHLLVLSFTGFDPERTWARTPPSAAYSIQNDSGLFQGLADPSPAGS